MSERRGEKDRDNLLAAMYGLDPTRLRQLRRILSGVTRCPACDAANPPEARRCCKCGEKLYPVEEADERRYVKRGEDEEDLV